VTIIAEKKGRLRFHPELDVCLIERVVWQGNKADKTDKLRISAGIWQYNNSKLVKLWIRQQSLRSYMVQKGKGFKRVKLPAPQWLNRSLGRVTYAQWIAIVQGIKDMLVEYNTLQSEKLLQ
jgi:hypothetical protein